MSAPEPVQSRVLEVREREREREIVVYEIIQRLFLLSFFCGLMILFK